MVSIIIPTLNEEQYLPRLLDSLAQQKVEGMEIIVADANSKDNTAATAQKYGCKVVKGGSPAQGRNAGAKAAANDTLVFVDADVVIPEGFLQQALREFEERELTVASVLLEMMDARFQSRVEMFYNKLIVLLERIIPHGAMFIMVKREAYERVGGFDEGVTVAEDMHFVRQAAKQGRFGILRTGRVLTSERRFLRESMAVNYLKFLLIELHMIVLGPVRSDIFKYRFDHHHDTP